MSEDKNPCYKCQTTAIEILKAWTGHRHSTPEQIAEIGRILHPQTQYAPGFKSREK